MSDGVSFKITGADELARKLESDPPIVARRIIRESLGTAMQPMRQDFIARVRRGWHIFQHATLRGKRGQGRAPAGREREFGVISQNVILRTKVGPGDYEGTCYVYPSKKAFWAKFLEFGTRKMHAFPFVRPGFETEKQGVLDNFIEDVRERLRDTMGLK